MLDIGWQELLIILVIALVVIGPRDLPKVVRTVGQWTGKARSYARDFQRSIEGYADESDLSAIQKEIAEANKELKEVRRDLDNEGKKLDEEMSEVEKGLHNNESQETNSVTNVKEEFIDENNKKSKNS
ncbi:MAG: twin-arginine translocase subunit TatB [Rhodospirillaceae bacterium]|nr:twin-arginine translocase subunit TatB [Rhodospirillaceae bacterium]